MIGKKMYGDETGMTGHKMNKQEENDKQKDKIMLMEAYRYIIYILTTVYSLYKEQVQIRIVTSKSFY